MASLTRSQPKRTMDKKEAVRHLLHSAVRMVVAQEDPFAIHMLVQSADKLLIDLARKTGHENVHNWCDEVRPEVKGELMRVIRETYNFFKHADRDHDDLLHVGDIARLNIVMLGVCVANYFALYRECTDHMKLASSLARAVVPDGFVRPDDRANFDAALTHLADTPLGELASDLRDPSFTHMAFPNFENERVEDIKDTEELYQTTIGMLGK